jgi:hypothetical protein
MDNTRKISIVFEKNKNAITFPTGGVYGGPTPNGEGIAIHFYTEYGTIPNSTTLDVIDGKITDPIGENISRGDVTREIQATTFVSPELAIIIASWLNDNANKILRNREGKP